jgi:hypothetical protein
VQSALTVLLIAAAVISRPIEARLWRAGRLSDRTTALLLVGRFPVVVGLFAIIDGGAPPLVAGVTLLGIVPAAMFYRFTLDLLREQSRLCAAAARGKVVQ